MRLSYWAFAGILWILRLFENILIFIDNIQSVDFIYTICMRGLVRIGDATNRPYQQMDTDPSR